VIHHVFANKSNIGDWLSARGIQSLLKDEEIVEHLCDAPFVSQTLERLAQIHPLDLVVIGGGGLFMDYFVPFWEGILGLGDRVRYCIWGVGYCDLKREPSRPDTHLLEQVVRGSRCCFVRDELTRNLLAACSLPPPVPCPSLAAVESQSITSRGLLHVDNYTTAGAEVYEAMDACGRRFAEQTHRTFLCTNNRIEAGDERALTRALQLYRRSDIVLSSALHGCVIAVATGRKVLAVSGDRKIESFMEAAGLTDWVCGLEQLAMLSERLARLDQQPSAEGFVQRSRRANQYVAEQVRALVSNSSNRRSVPRESPETNHRVGDDGKRTLCGNGLDAWPVPHGSGENGT